MESRSPLAELVATYPSLLVGYSGGVDSTLLSVVARTVLGPERSLAVIGVSASFARAQHEQALQVARDFDLTVAEIATDELEDPEYAANPTNRCYFCKRTLWRHLTAIARARGFAIVADGTNLDDAGDHRPGRGAGAEAGIRSPL